VTWCRVLMASSGAAPALGLLSASRESWRRLGRMSAVRPPGIPAVRRQATRPKPAKLAINQRLHAEVQSKLIARLSPEQVTAYLHREFPDDPGMWVSPETIHQSAYVQGRGALRRELALCLRTGRALRKPRRRATERRGRIPGMVGTLPGKGPVFPRSK
jgi:IS30 family transposase